MELPELSGEMFSSDEEHLAKQAYEAFQNQNYESCLSHLTKLVELRPNDSRVLHNRYEMITCIQIISSILIRAVAKYNLSNLTLTDDFRKSLNNISQRVSIHGIMMYHVMSVRYRVILVIVWYYYSIKLSS